MESFSQASTNVSTVQMRPTRARSTDQANVQALEYTNQPKVSSTWANGETTPITARAFTSTPTTNATRGSCSRARGKVRAHSTTSMVEFTRASGYVTPAMAMESKTVPHPIKANGNKISNLGMGILSLKMDPSMKVHSSMICHMGEGPIRIN